MANSKLYIIANYVREYISRISMSSPVYIRIYHYMTPQLKVLNRKESLYFEAPPEHTRKSFEHILKESNGDVPRVLANLMNMATKHIQTFTEFAYETTPGGEVRNTPVATYLFIFENVDWETMPVVM